MWILFIRSRAGVAVSLTGLTGLATIILAFTLPDYLLSGMTPAAAEQRIRQYYQQELSRQQLAELNRSHRSMPDLATARAWKADRTRVGQLVFDKTEVKRPWIDVLSDLPNYLARTSVRSTLGDEKTRCFWLDAERFDREVPTWLWYVLY